MSIGERISNGWNIALNSWKVLRENKHLIILPILSMMSLTLIVGSFFVGVLSFNNWDISHLQKPDTIIQYLVILVFYIVNYFVVIFFNVALVHCVSMYFKGEKLTVSEGIQFSKSRLGAIFGWAVFGGSVGAILKIIQENTGSIGKIITRIIGVVWGIATFFVVPVIAYENLGPIGAFKRSAIMMKNKWGERIGAGFSFGLISLACFIIIAVIGLAIGALLHPLAGIAVALIGIVMLATVMSALRTIFVTAIYHNVNGDPVQLYHQQFIDNLFIPKKTKDSGF